MNVFKKWWLIIFGLLLFTIFISGCGQKFVEQTEGFKIDKETLYSKETLNKTYAVLDFIELPLNLEAFYDSSRPFYYDKESEKHKCSKFDETAKETVIFDTPIMGGHSRFAYYCKGENVYWIKDHPGTGTALIIYGPFEGRPTSGVKIGMKFENVEPYISPEESDWGCPRDDSFPCTQERCEEYIPWVRENCPNFKGVIE